MPTKEEIVVKTNATVNKSSDKSKVYNWTKVALIVIAVFVMLIGTLGSMHWTVFKSFNMTDFINFIEAYKGIFMTLTGSICVGGVAKNVIKKLKDKNNKSQDDGEALVKGNE